jgi:hypothetical protein
VYRNSDSHVVVMQSSKEALALIDELMRHATQKKYEYRHKWRHGDWVLWDNRSVMHQANPDYDMRGAPQKACDRTLMWSTAATSRMVNTMAQTSAGSGAGSSWWFVIGATPAVSSWRTPPSRPRASARSRASASGPHDARRGAYSPIKK